MVRLLFLKSLLATIVVTPIKVAVIDTGFDTKSKWDMVQPKICPNGTKNLFDGTNDVTDIRRHGTHVSGLIALHAEEANYCLYIFKAIDDNIYDTSANINAFKSAIKAKVDIINYSAGGISYIEDECKVIKKALDKGIKVIVAAGNNGQDLRTNSYYPAKCDPRIIRVGNLQSNGKLNRTSNYSTTPFFEVVYEFGTDVKSIYPDNRYAIKSGTSMATAIISGKTAKDLWMQRVKDKLDSLNKDGSIPSRSLRHGCEKR